MKIADVMMMTKVATSYKKKEDTNVRDESSCVTKFFNTCSFLSTMQELLQLACVWHTNTFSHSLHQNMKITQYNTPNLRIHIDHQTSKHWDIFIHNWCSDHHSNRTQWKSDNLL